MPRKRAAAKAKRAAAKQREDVFSQRRRRLLRAVKGEAALFVAAPERVSSYDQLYPYRADSNFYYLTGIEEPDCALVIRGDGAGPRTILFVREKDAVAERWTGPRIGTRHARKLCPVDEVRDFRSFEGDLNGLLGGLQTLHFSPGVHPRIDQLVWRLFQSPLGPRGQLPSVLKDSRNLLHEMRFIKDRDEARLLKHVADLTAHSFIALFRNLRTVKSELHAARLLEGFFAEYGASGLAFQTIVASGKNATCLHHSPRLQPLWRNELVLIDAGASYRGYAADITRTVPASGKFSPAQAKVYDVVLKGFDAGLKKSKPGSTLDDIHDAVTLAITEGLVELKILKGKPEALHQAGKFRPYYMHRSGHWLGLDVHDVSPAVNPEKGTVEHSSKRAIVPGNAFTLEPGLYFDANDKTVPKQYRGIGIRIEDDILATEQGSTVLSAAVPRDREALEALIGQSSKNGR